MNIKTMLDIPCGDFNWMQNVNLSKTKYVGADIVNEMIVENNRKYAKENNIDFVQKNLIADELPASDLILIRDCLVHLSFGDIYNALKNMKSSGSKYLFYQPQRLLSIIKIVIL